MTYGEAIVITLLALAILCLAIVGMIDHWPYGKK
jgi:hypothetical protein